MVADGTGSGGQVAGPQLQGHERLGGRIVLAGEAEAGCRVKAETRVVRWMAEYDDRPHAELSAGFEPGEDQRRANPSPLKRGQNRHRSETQQMQLGVTGQRDWTEKDMAENLVVLLGDPRDQRPRHRAQLVHEVRFRGRLEGGEMDRPDAGWVWWAFRADDYGGT